MQAIQPVGENNLPTMTVLILDSISHAATFWCMRSSSSLFETHVGSLYAGTWYRVFLCWLFICCNARAVNASFGLSAEICFHVAVLVKT